MQNLHVLTLFAWALLRYTGFLPKSKEVYAGITGEYKCYHLSNCEHEYYLSVLALR